MIQEVFRCEFCHKEFEEDCLHDHSEICPFKPVDCENVCGVRVYQKDIINHNEYDCIKKRAICEHCQRDLIENNIGHKKMNYCRHDCDCPLFVSKDVNKQFETLWNAMSKPCDYEYANCKFRGSKKALEKHLQEKSQYHFQLLEAKVVEQAERLAKKSSNSYEWEISDWNIHITRISSIWSAKELISPEFYTHPCGYRIKAILYPGGMGFGLLSHMSVFLQLVSGEYDNQLSWPFRLIVKVTLLDKKGGVDYTKTFNTAFPKSMNYRSYHCFERPINNLYNKFGDEFFILRGQVSDGQFAKDDKLHLKFTFSESKSYGLCSYL